MEILTRTPPPGLLRPVHNTRLLTLFFSKISVYILILSMSYTVHATVFTYNLRSSEASVFLDGVNSGGFVIDILTATFSALPGAQIDGVFNQTGSRFGINTLSSSDDSSSLIDAVNGFSEFLSVSFSENVLLEKIVLSAFAPGEQAHVLVEGGSAFLLNGMSHAIDEYYFSDYAINPGEQLILAHVLGNGFSFDSLVVSLVSVPEPAVLILRLAGIISLTIFRPRKDRG